MSNMLTNGAMFSTFKRTDSHTVRGRPTRKDGVVIYERLFRLFGIFLQLAKRKPKFFSCQFPFCKLTSALELNLYFVVGENERYFSQPYRTLRERTIPLKHY